MMAVGHTPDGPGIHLYHIWGRRSVGPLLFVVPTQGPETANPPVTVPQGFVLRQWYQFANYEATEASAGTAHLGRQCPRQTREGLTPPPAR